MTASITLSRLHHVPLPPFPIGRTPLSDAVLGVHNSSAHLPHPLTTPPLPPPSCGEVAWEAFYPAGSVNPSSAIPGGFGFYLGGPEGFRYEIAGAREVLMEYEVLFEEGFAWGKGGKLPGMFGGVGDLAYGCSGGRTKARCQCFDLRLMWRYASPSPCSTSTYNPSRDNGQGELYAYLPLTAPNAARMLAVPGSRPNGDYGFSVGRGAFGFEGGRWTTVAQRVRLNDIGQENGEVEVYIDGTSVISVQGLTLRDDAVSHVQGLHFQTFFGGSSPEWASPKDQRAWFAGVSGAILI
ncbi:hypothetical protein GLOTRDRAFT_129709 [Gloeophyllum trabeum ATCC 11539]|uniref:Polysaccharide lyase 14 domain-containing protein n=1 Tax=Gloeophyllum trabeum (strain ATCC 11539 / FP-39264 / Madison 617) TaxID=670483 RepID=S7Q7C9_GLOTA|nr:uncharacterized protein GLOTRDRAFT_129709 [Gloeophyllum trabeum ATCC 11539]EPQ55437.1 hypothetical protein GLOTRDRAFT_129709 [Gloeophyllum trabeum ATCC 11539]